MIFYSLSSLQNRSYQSTYKRHFAHIVKTECGMIVKYLYRAKLNFEVTFSLLLSQLKLLNK